MNSEPLVPKFQNILISFKFEGLEQHIGMASPLERNQVLAVLPTGLGKSLIFQLFDIAAEIERHINCLDFREHYRSMTRFQKPETWVFQLHSTANRGGVEVGVISANFDSAMLEQ